VLLERRVAVVTGGSRGVGKGVAVELGAAGATVYLATEYGFTDVNGTIPAGTP
jgi:dehydrogenase/reductase SDR family protein 1